MNAMLPVIALVTALSLSPAQAAGDVVATTADTTITTEVKTDAATSENYTLENGTSVVVENGLVFTVDADGVRTPAVDGDHATQEGKTLNVKAGALVDADAKADAKTEINTSVDVAE